ncbi:MAG: PIN domain-containing protein [bacterium]
MKPIKGKSFLDTNILIYFIGEEITKQSIAGNIIYSENELLISTQVINEFINVSYKKLSYNTIQITSILNILKKRISVKIISENTINRAISLKDIYKYSYCDSLILASALEHNCEYIYSEDFQDSTNR